MTATPKTLQQKLTQYQSDSFNVWLQKTNVVAMEEGALGSLNTDILNSINSSEETLNLVNAINFVYETTLKELRNVLIKSIAMS